MLILMLYFNVDGPSSVTDQQQISFTEVRSLDLQSALFQWEDNSSSKKLPSATIVSGNINIQSKQSICPTTGKEKDKDAGMNAYHIEMHIILIYLFTLYPHFLSLPYNSLTYRSSRLNLKHVSLHKHDNDKFCCSFCRKQVKNFNKSLLCNLCSHSIHHKCTELPRYQIKALKKKLWKCPSGNNLPFHNVENTELLMPTKFNSLVDNDYTNSQLHDSDTKFLSELPVLEIFNSTYNQLSPQNDMDIDNHLTIENDFSFYNLHDFHKLCSNNVHNKGNALSFLHSNIRSYQKNIEQFETLLNQ